MGSQEIVSAQNTELKIYKKLYELERNMLSRVQSEVRNLVEYTLKRADGAEDLQKKLEHIANPAQWDYSGVRSKEDSQLHDFLLYLLDDEAEAPRKSTKEWKPIER